jgi:hypothetical protein
MKIFGLDGMNFFDQQIDSYQGRIVSNPPSSIQYEQHRNSDTSMREVEYGTGSKQGEIEGG